MTLLIKTAFGLFFVLCVGLYLFALFWIFIGHFLICFTICINVVRLGFSEKINLSII